MHNSLQHNNIHTYMQYTVNKLYKKRACINNYSLQRNNLHKLQASTLLAIVYSMQASSITYVAVTSAASATLLRALINVRNVRYALIASTTQQQYAITQLQQSNLLTSKQCTQCALLLQQLQQLAQY